MTYFTVSKLNGKVVVDSIAQDPDILYNKFPDKAIYYKKSLKSIYDVCGGIRVSLKKP